MRTEEAVQLALRYHQAGQLREAEAAYRKILQSDPGNAGVLHLLGLLLYQSGNHEKAAELIAQAIALNKREPLFHFNLGKVLRDAGRRAEAEKSYRRAAQLKPDYAEAYANLAGILEKDRPDEAMACYRKALQLRPGDAMAHNGLGVLLKQRGEGAQAEECYRQALRFAPAYPEALVNLGNLLAERGKTQEAAEHYRRALAIKPQLPDAQTSLGILLLKQGDLAGAEERLRHVLRNLDPANAEAWRALGAVCYARNRPGEALPCLEKALELAPDMAGAHSGLGAALSQLGLFEQGIAAYRRALALKPDKDTHSALIFVLHYRQGDPDEIFRQSLAWDERYAPSAPIPPHANPRDPERRLRVGYVSGDFRNHPVAHFIEGVFAAREHTEIFVYSNLPVALEDGQTEKLRGLADCWKNISDAGDDEAAEMIRADCIDILVDLAGHSAKNRLSLFARKPAPVQATWLGYCDTTGLRTMDYLLADETVIPPHSAQKFTERIWRLPGSYLCYAPRGHAPGIAAPPMTANRYATFGCFNNLAKVSEDMIGVWAEILRRLPDARFLLKARQFSDEKIYRCYLGYFEARGISGERIELNSDTPDHAGLLGYYNRLDIALDTFPYGGVTTTCEAAWMGVPVVTLAGDRFISRNSASILTSLGLSDLIAATPEKYVEIAVNLARDPERLAQLRYGMRGRFSASPLGDARLFTRNLEAAYRDMWRTWCGAG